MLRCPLCAGLSHAPVFGAWLRCHLCALVFAAEGAELPPLEEYRIGGDRYGFPSWTNWLSRATGRLSPRRDRAPYFAPQTVRMFAERGGWHVGAIGTSLPLMPIAAGWRYGRTILARIGRWPDAAEPGPHRRLTLGIIAASGAVEDVLRLCGETADVAGRVVVALDTADQGAGRALEAALAGVLAPGSDVVVIAHRLGGDFAAQRNRVQDAARTDWVLQLDCDERLSNGMRMALPQVIKDAERAGWHGVAFTRRNMVDGVMTAMFPDPQYRLLRRSVRFIRPVHEYPDLGRHTPSFVHLGPGIIHTIANQRLATREELYEAIQPGAGRPGDTLLLRQPLEAGICVPA